MSILPCLEACRIDIPYLRAKDYLAHEAKVALDPRSESPPLTPLSQINYYTTEDEEESEFDEGPSFGLQQQDEQAEFYRESDDAHRHTAPINTHFQNYSENPTPTANLLPLDQLFLSMGGPTPTQPSQFLPFDSTTNSYAQSQQQVHATANAFITSTSQTTHSQTTSAFSTLSPAFQGLPNSQPPVAAQNDANRLNSLLQNAFMQPQPQQLPNPIQEIPSRSGSLPPSAPGANQGISLLNELFASSAAASQQPSVPTSHHGSTGQPTPMPGPTRELSTPPQNGNMYNNFSDDRGHSHPQPLDSGADSDEVLLPERSHQRQGRGRSRQHQHRSRSRRQESNARRAASNAGATTETDDAGEEYQELEAPPSPSLIPNPLHTPAPALAMRQSLKPRGGKPRNRRGKRRNEGANGYVNGHSRSSSDTTGIFPVVGNGLIPRNADEIQSARRTARSRGGGGNGRHRRRESYSRPEGQYIPQNSSLEEGAGSRLASDVDLGGLGDALLDARREHLAEKEGEEAGGSLSKYDFVSELLMLIHVRSVGFTRPLSSLIMLTSLCVIERTCFRRRSIFQIPSTRLPTVITHRIPTALRRTLNDSTLLAPSFFT